MQKRAIHPGDSSPRALGSYSHALVVGDLLFVSGQGCRSPKTGQEVGLTLDGEGKVVAYDIEAQTRGVLENLRSVLTLLTSRSSWQTWTTLTNTIRFMVSILILKMPRLAQLCRWLGCPVKISLKSRLSRPFQEVLSDFGKSLRA